MVQLAQRGAAILLLIVAGRDSALYRYLTYRFTGLPDVQIILDRRQGERRREHHVPAVDRRRGSDRRHIEGERHFGYTLVRL